MSIRKIFSIAVPLTFLACAPPAVVDQPAALASHASHQPTACQPANGRQGQPGCWVIATAPIGAPTTPLYWHVYELSSAEQASGHASEPAKVIPAFGRTWLVAVADREWRASAGRHVASVGPLKLLSSAPHTASFMEATFTPGMLSRIHTHPGPEAWVVLEGEQCLETQEGVIRAKAGDAMMVRGGIPMALFGPFEGPWFSSSIRQRNRWERRTTNGSQPGLVFQSNLGCADVAANLMAAFHPLRTSARSRVS